MSMTPMPVSLEIGFNKTFKILSSINNSASKLHCKKSDFLFVKSTGEMLRVKSEMYFLV